MFDSLDVLIGLVTVYLTLAFACTAIVEAIAAWMKMRGKILEKALQEYFAGNLTESKPFVEEFYNHPLVWSLSQGKDGLPSYIPYKIVGQVVETLVMANGPVTRAIDAVDNPLSDIEEENRLKRLFERLVENAAGDAAVLRKAGEMSLDIGVNRTKDAAGSLYQAVENLPGSPKDNHIKGLLSALLDQAKGDSEEFRKAVEEHFSLVMDRASGWFKRHQQNVALAVSVVIVCVANVDTFSLATSLSRDKTFRESMVSYAEELLKKEEWKPADKAPIVPGDPVKDALGKSAEASKAVDQARASLGEFEMMQNDKLGVKLEFGWTSKNTPAEAGGWFAKIIGLLITAFAVSLGAPFWFDLLKRFMQVRQAGKPPGKPPGKPDPGVCKPE